MTRRSSTSCSLPPSSDYFFHLPAPVQRRRVEQQKLASDGISRDLLAALARRFYELEFLAGVGRFFHLTPDTLLVAMERRGEHWRLDLHSPTLDAAETVDCDLVVLATGFEYLLPCYLEPLIERLDFDDAGNLCFREDYSIRWDGPPENKIFVQNAARHCRGVADPNLSLMAWRSAKIINSIAGRAVYDVAEVDVLFDWPGRQMSVRGRDEESAPKSEVIAAGNRFRSPVQQRRSDPEAEPTPVAAARLELARAEESSR